MFTETSIRAEISTTSEPPEPRPATDKEFSDFLKNVERQAFRIARYKVRREEAAHDIVQDAMIGLMRSRQRNSLPSASLRPMFFTILKYSILGYFRREKVRKSREVLFSDLNPNTEDSEDYDFLSSYEAEDGSMSCESSADTAERNQIIGILDEEAHKLTALQQEAFRKRYVEGSELAEVAAAMEHTPHEVQGQYLNARRKLARALKSRSLPTPKTQPKPQRSDKASLRKPAPACVTKAPLWRRPTPQLDASPLNDASGNVVLIDLDADLVRIAPRYLRENDVGRYSSCWADIYLGAPAALIAAGIIEEHMLPGQPNRPRMRVTINFTEERPDGAGYLQIAKRTSRHLEVRKGVSEEEVSRRLLERDRMRQTRAEPALRLVVTGRAQ